MCSATGVPVEIPSRATSSARRDYVFLTHAQLRALAAEAEPWRAFVLTLGYTGLRWGEATALRVCDIDLARRRIDVGRAFSVSIQGGAGRRLCHVE
jgi:integrase